jgi:hypothetical protein
MIDQKQKTVFDIDPGEFLPHFRELIFAPQAVQIFIGSAGSGKSVFLHKRAVLFCLSKKYFRLLYGKKVKDTVRDSLFLGIKDVIHAWNLAPYFSIRESQMDFECRLNGNLMLSFGMDDPEKLKSIAEPTHVLYEEFSDSTPDEFAELRRRLRTKKVKQTQFWGALNPVAEFWGREYFFADPEAGEIPKGVVASSRADTLIFKSTYKDNRFVDQEETRQKNEDLAILDENNWTVYELGNWGNLATGGEFYHQFKKRVHVGDVPFLPELPVHISFDFNVLPYMTMIAAQVKRDDLKLETGKMGQLFTIRIFKEYCLPDPLNTTENCVFAFLDDYGHHKRDIFFYGDAMGNKRHEGTGSKTEFKKVRELLARFIDDGSDRTFRSNPSVLQSRNFMNKIFAESAIVPGVHVRIIIDSKCKETIKDFEKVKLGAEGILKQRHKDKKTGQTWELYGHASDTVRYLTCKMFEDYFKAFAV